MEDGELDVEEGEVAAEGVAQVQVWSWLTETLYSSCSALGAVTERQQKFVRSLQDHLFRCHLTHQTTTECYHSASQKRQSLQKQWLQDTLTCMAVR